MPRQLQGSQTDFSFGEVDVSLKRNDNHPARKGGLRQMANARLLNTGAVQQRPGRRALYPITNSGTRTERFTISPGNTFDIQFGASRIKIIDSTGTTVANFTTKGGGGAFPWTANTTGAIRYAILGLSIYITNAGMRPQVITWDGVSTWSIADYNELVIGNQKRTPFYRISPRGITLTPSASSGAGVTVQASSPLFTASWVGVRIRYVGRQMLVTAFINTQQLTVTVEEALPGGQTINFGALDASTIFAVGDVVIGSTSGSKGIITAFSGIGNINIEVQLLTLPAASVGSTAAFLDTKDTSNTTTVAFLVADVIAGPGGSVKATSVSAVGAPKAVTFWDDEVMNDFRGYPASCFVDQFRLGFCNFPSVPGGVAWSSINTTTDLYVGPNPSDAMFEIAPGKVQVFDVVPGPEGSEFAFCDRGIFYIPISETNPLKPGSVAFKRLSGDGAFPVQPRLAQEAILYVNAGQSSLMAVIATGAYLRPFNTKSLTDYHFHLFNAIQCIAAPSADDATFNERYAYVLNGDGSITVGKYDAASLAGNAPVIGWGPWSGAGAVSWIAAWASDVLFTSTYFGNGVVEILDDAEFLDCKLAVNNLPTAFVVGGKGPLWLVAPSQSVTLMDQVTRAMGTYQVDANGFIIPQNLGGEDLTAVSLVAGQPWSMTIEPFTPAAQPGADVHQRMELRQISKIGAYVLNSTGFVWRALFNSRQTATSPVLGTAMNERRVPMWNVDDDATKPPTQRETLEFWTPTGSSYDPRVAIVKDTPGPLIICEIATEITL